jgi:hypothetical protein
LAIKNSQNQRGRATAAFIWVSCGPIRFPISSASLDGADHDLQFDHIAGIVEFDEVDAPEPPFANIGGKFQRGVGGSDKRAVIGKILRFSAPWSAPAKSRRAGVSAIARSASETQYTLYSAGSGRRIAGSEKAASPRGSVVATAPARGFRLSLDFPGNMFLAATHWSGSTMKGDEHRREGQTGGLAKKDPGKDSRRDRLKLALRENLKRRKSQARERSDTTPSNPDGASPHDGSGKKPGQ